MHQAGALPNTGTRLCSIIALCRPTPRSRISYHVSITLWRVILYHNHNTTSRISSHACMHALNLTMPCHAMPFHATPLHNTVYHIATLSLPFSYFPGVDEVGVVWFTSKYAGKYLIMSPAPGVLDGYYNLVPAPLVPTY